MKLSAQQVHHVARLARLELTEAEKLAAQTQLSAILDAVDVLAAFETLPAPATDSTAATSHLREDVVTSHLGSDQTLANAPAKHDTSFAVPRVIE